MSTASRVVLALGACLSLLGACSSQAIDHPDGSPMDGGPHPECGYGGTTYPAGASFPSSDGCNTCQCTASGQVACTLRACVDAHVAVDPICNFDRTYRFWYDGGDRAYVDRSVLRPARTHEIGRDLFMNAAPDTCSRELVCIGGSSPSPGVDEIMAILRDPDVVSALQMATPPFYGTDPRPSDGVVFMFRRDDDHGFTVGSGSVPDGVRAVRDLLLAVTATTIADPACANLPRP